MKTKAEIIQKLLDKKHIKVEEAMVLMEKEKEYIYQHYYPYYYWSVQPFITTPCLSTGHLSGTIQGNATNSAIVTTTTSGEYSYSQN